MVEKSLFDRRGHGLHDAIVDAALRHSVRQLLVFFHGLQWLRAEVKARDVVEV